MAITNENLTAKISVESGDSLKNLNKLSIEISKNDVAIKNLQGTIDNLSLSMDLNNQKNSEIIKILIKYDKNVLEVTKKVDDMESSTNNLNSSLKNQSNTLDSSQKTVASYNDSISNIIINISNYVQAAIALKNSLIKIEQLEEKISSGELDKYFLRISNMLALTAWDKGFYKLSIAILMVKVKIIELRKEYSKLREEALKNINDQINYSEGIISVLLSQINLSAILKDSFKALGIVYVSFFSTVAAARYFQHHMMILSANIEIFQKQLLISAQNLFIFGKELKASYSAFEGFLRLVTSSSLNASLFAGFVKNRLTENIQQFALALNLLPKMVFNKILDFDQKKLNSLMIFFESLKIYFAVLSSFTFHKVTTSLNNLAEKSKTVFIAISQGLTQSFSQEGIDRSLQYILAIPDAITKAFSKENLDKSLSNIYSFVRIAVNEFKILNVQTIKLIESIFFNNVSIMTPLSKMIENLIVNFKNIRNSLPVSNMLLFIEAGASASSIIAILGEALLKTDDILKKAFGLTLIITSVALGGFAAIVMSLINIIGNLATKIGGILINSMEDFAKSAKSAESTLAQFNFTLKGFAKTLGEENVGSIQEWNAVIESAFTNSTFKVNELRKSVKLLIAEGAALNFDYATNVDLFNRSLDVAAANGVELSDVIANLAQALSGTQSTGLLNYGINLQEVALSHSKFSLEIGKTVDKMTNQEKVQGRIYEFMKQTTPIIGSAALQTQTWSGKVEKLSQNLDILKQKVGASTSLTLMYHEILVSIANMFTKIPDSILVTVGTLWDLSGVILTVMGSLISLSMNLLAIGSIYKLLSTAVEKFALIQLGLGTIFTLMNKGIGANIIAVKTLNDVFRNAAAILSGTLIVVMKQAIIYLGVMAKQVGTLALAVLANPLFYKALAILAGIVIVTDAFKQLYNELSPILSINVELGSSFSWISSVANLIKNVFMKAFSAATEVLKIFIQGLIGAVAVVAKITLELANLATQGKNEELAKQISKVDNVISGLSKNIEKNFSSIASGFDKGSLSARSYGKNLEKIAEESKFLELRTKTMSDTLQSIDKAAITTLVLGDSYDVLSSKILFATKAQEKNTKEYLAGSETGKQNLEDYKKAVEDQYQAEAEIKKLRIDTIKAVNDQINQLTLDSLRSSTDIIAATRFEYSLKRAEIEKQIVLLEKLYGTQRSNIKEVTTLLNKLNTSEKEAIQNAINKRDAEEADVRLEVYKKEAERLKDQQQLLQDIETKNGELNRTIAVDGVTAREAINAQLEYQLSLVDQNIERSSILYGENSAIVQALEKQKQLLQDQAKIDKRKLLPALPSEIITNFWNEFSDQAMAYWDRITESFSQVEMPSISFGGFANLGKQLLSMGQGVGSAIAQGGSALLSYASMAVDFILQLPEILLSTFIELPKAILSALTKIPEILDQIIEEFPTIIQELVQKLPGLLVSIAAKIPDFIMMLLEQLPIIIEKLAEAIPAIIVILIKNLPKMVFALIKALVNGTLALIRGLGKGIMDLLTGKKIKLDKIVDTKGLQNKIDKLSGETGKLFNVSDWTEAAQKPLDQIGASISEAGKKGRDYLLEAGRWLDEKLWQPLGDIVRRAWSFVSNLWESLKDVVASAWEFVKNLWEGLKDAVAQAWQFVANLWEGLKDIVAGAWQMVSDLWENLKGAVAGAWQFVKDLWDGLSGAVSGAFQWVLDKVWTPLSELGQKIGDGFLNAIKGVGNFFSGIWEGFKNLFKFDFSGIGKAISGAFDSAMSGLRGVFAAVINPIVDVFNGLIGALNNLKIPGVSIKVPGWAGGGKWNLWDDIDLIPGNIGQLAKFAQGGLVQNGGMNLPGFGTDTVPAMLTPGEFVVSKRGVEGVGLGMLQAINQGSSPGSNNYNIEFNINIDAKTNVDEGYIRGTLIPRMQEEMKRASLDGKFVISSRGIR